MTTVLDVPVLDHPEPTSVTTDRTSSNADITLLREPSAVADGRAWLGIALAGWGIGEDDTYTAQLMLSELHSNAIRHGGDASAGDKTEITVSFGNGLLLVTVSDPDPDTREFRSNASDSAESGRGLMIVSELSADFGAYRTDDGKVTWFQMDISTPGGGAK